MNSYIAFFSLSVLLHGQPTPKAESGLHGMTSALHGAWSALQALPSEWMAEPSRNAASSDGARVAMKGPAHAGMAERSPRPDPIVDPRADGSGFTVLANSGAVRILTDADEEEIAPGEFGQLVPLTGNTAKDCPEPDAGFGVGSLNMHTTVGIEPATAAYEEESPIEANDIEIAFMDEDEPPSDGATGPDEDEASSEDFRDFGRSFGGHKANEPPAVSGPGPNNVEPASTGKMPDAGSQDAGAAGAAQPNEAHGLSTDLRQGISIARMTLKDQPSELIRVAVNTSMVVDLSGQVDGANIVDPTIADIIVPAPNRVIVVGKGVGTTQLVLTVGQEHRVFHVYVEPNLVVLTDLIRTMAPRSDIRIGSLNGQLVLQGSVPDATTAKQIEELAKAYQGRDVINHLMVSGTQQTLLRVVVAEVNKEALRNLGFNWAIGASDWSRDFFFANNVGQLNPTTFSSSGLANVLNGQQLYSVGAVGNGSQTNVSFGFPKAELQIFMNALRQNGLARTLAEPNLVAISGQTATFLAGGEVPIPVSQGGSVAGAITIEYKEFGVRLAFTPTVGADQIIRLHVMTEVSDAVPGSRQIDAIPVFTFRTRRVESTIECPNGKTFAIAGLLNETVNAIASKIPGLGDVPVLGQLFTSVDYQRSNTELVVLVTPQLVEALEPNQVPPPPGMMMQHPTDWELFGLGQLEGKTLPRSAEKSGGVDGSHDGTLVERSRTTPVHARLQGTYGVEDREPGALEE